MGSVLGTKPGAEPLFCAARISSPELLAERGAEEYPKGTGVYG